MMGVQSVFITPLPLAFLLPVENPSTSPIKPTEFQPVFYCRDTLIHQHKEFKANTDYYRKELTKLIEEKNYYESDSQEVWSADLSVYVSYPLEAIVWVFLYLN